MAEKNPTFVCSITGAPLHDAVLLENGKYAMERVCLLQKREFRCRHIET